MSDGTQATHDDDPSEGRVEIRVQGYLEPHWSEWLDGLALTRNDDATTLIEGTVVDQAALFGVIDRLRDMAVPLISVRHTGASPATRPPADRSPASSSTTPSSRPRSQS